MNRFYIFLTLLLALPGCSPEEEYKKKNRGQSSFDILCEQFTKLTMSDIFQNLNNEEWARKLDTMLANSLDLDSDAYLAWQAIRNGPPSARYSLYKNAAVSSGQEDWDCEAINHYGREVGSTHN